MVVSVVYVDLFMPSSHSLKEKRNILRPVKYRLRRDFNVSVIESDYHDKWQRTALVIAIVRRRRHEIDETISRLENLIREYRDIEVIDLAREDV